MATSKYTDRFWYFRNEADEDDDDNTGASIMIPTSSITGFVTTAINKLRIYFEYPALGNQLEKAVAGEQAAGNHGYVELNVTRGKIKQVMAVLVEAMNAGPHQTGFTVIADESTTDFDNSTRAKVFLHPDITGVQEIRNSYSGVA